jgi:hypothetical protein
MVKLKMGRTTAVRAFRRRATVFSLQQAIDFVLPVPTAKTASTVSVWIQIGASSKAFELSSDM